MSRIRRLLSYFVIANLSLSTCAPAVVAADSPPSRDTTQTQQSQRVKDLFQGVNDLVIQYFPKAKVTQTPTKLHFEFKVYERLHPYIMRNVMSPDLDGILGDLEVKTGGPKNRMVGFLERPETIHTVLQMSPYCSADQTYVATRMVFQPVTPMVFINAFKELIKSYDSGDVTDNSSSNDTASGAGASTGNATIGVNASSATSSSNANSAAADQTSLASNLASGSGSDAATTGSASSATAVASVPVGAKPDAPVKTETDTKAFTMSRYNYPEGRFRVQLPIDPSVKYSDQGGMRMVDYVSVVPEGSLNISYVILPAAPSSAHSTELLDNMSQSVVNSLKGLHARQSPASLQGYPGCQLSMPELANKAGHAAEFKIFLVQNYIYIIGVAGKKDWLTSPTAKEFFSSFQVSPVVPRSSYTTPAPAPRSPASSPMYMGTSPAATPAAAAPISEAQKDREKQRADSAYHRMYP